MTKKIDFKMGYTALGIGIVSFALVLAYLSIIKKPNNNHSKALSNMTNQTDNGNQAERKNDVKTTPKSLSNNVADNIQNNLKSGAILIDVRTPEEFAAGRAKLAINLPLGEIENGSLPKVANDYQIYLYCRSGNRSSIAKRLLISKGYSNIVDLGGLGDIQALGLEMIK